MYPPKTIFLFFHTIEFLLARDYIIQFVEFQTADHNPEFVEFL